MRATARVLTRAPGRGDRLRTRAATARPGTPYFTEVVPYANGRRARCKADLLSRECARVPGRGNAVRRIGSRAPGTRGVQTRQCSPDWPGGSSGRLCIPKNRSAFRVVTRAASPAFIRFSSATRLPTMAA